MKAIAFSTRLPTKPQPQMMKAGETLHSKFWLLPYGYVS